MVNDLGTPLCGNNQRLAMPIIFTQNEQRDLFDPTHWDDATSIPFEVVSLQRMSEDHAADGRLIPKWVTEP